MAIHRRGVNNMRQALALIFILIAISTSCDAQAKRPPPVDQDMYHMELRQLCESHQVKYCPRLDWHAIKPDKIKDGKIACGFDRYGDRVCIIALWTRAELESLRHEFAHFLTWVKKSDGRTGTFGHGSAFKRARSVVNRPNEMTHGAGGCVPNHSTGGCL